MNFWLVVTSPKNFRKDREVLGFKLQGLPIRCRNQVKKMHIGDKVVYYIVGLRRFGAIATITGDYNEDYTKIWIDDDEMWPARRPSEPEIVLQDNELIDVKKLVPSLSFIKIKDNWGAFFQGSIHQIPEDDFRLIESEMKKVKVIESQIPHLSEMPLQLKSEKDHEDAIMRLKLNETTLHDRLCEMLEQIGTWMNFNTQKKHKIAPDSPYELDVAWLTGKNPEVAIEVQISGNLTEAKDRLRYAKKFNYRKLILVIRESEMQRLNSLMKHDPELRNWMDAWSIGAIYEMYDAGGKFFNFYRRLIEAVYKEKPELKLIK